MTMALAFRLIELKMTRLGEIFYIMLLAAAAAAAAAATTILQHHPLFSIYLTNTNPIIITSPKAPRPN